MTYNIQCGFLPWLDPWEEYDTGGTEPYLDSMTHFLITTGADVIALQEVPWTEPTRS